MKIAIVHDFLMQMGGAEKVVEVLHDMYPDAPVYTSAYDAEAMPAAYRSWDIRTSFLQNLLMKRHTHRMALLLYPIAFEGFDLSIMMWCSAPRLGVCQGRDHAAAHAAYLLHAYAHALCLDDALLYARTSGCLEPCAACYSRERTICACGTRWRRSRVDQLVANSSAVAKRIRKFYRRDSVTIHPPVNTQRFQLSEDRGDYYIIVSRFVPYKRLDLAVEAFTRMNRPLKVVGTGRQMQLLAAAVGQ